MKAALIQKRPWLTPRFMAAVMVCFVVQFALILWLGQREIPSPRPAGAAPSLQFVADQALAPSAALGPLNLLQAPLDAAFQMLSLADREVLKVNDPTLFALPHREGFSGSAWLSIPSQDVQPFVWTEPPRFLELTQQPSLTLPPAAIAPGELWPRSAESAADPFLPLVIETRYFAEPSQLQISGPLSSRRLLTQLQLPSWQFTDVLSNTVVQVLVTPEGRAFSWTLLERSGLKAADDRALQVTREARFEPVAGANDLRGTPMLTWGELVFEWQTVPAIASGSPGQ